MEVVGGMRSGTAGRGIGWTGSEAIRLRSGEGGGGTGIGLRWSTLKARRTRTPRPAARRIASPTTAPLSGPSSKSYCARSSVRSAPSRNAATASAISRTDWPPSVSVRTWISGSIDAIIATIGPRRTLRLPFSPYEDLQRQDRRNQPRVVPRRCRWEDPRPSGDADRRPPARQGQAAVHPARRHGRLRRGRERREDHGHRQQARQQDVLPPFGLSRRVEDPDPP